MFSAKVHLMHILFVTGYYKPAYVYGGPTKSLATLCAGLVTHGAHVTVFTTNANGRQRLDVPLGTPVMVDGVAVSYFPLCYQGLGFFYAPAMAQSLPDQIARSDLVVIESIWGYQLLLAARQCLKQRKPYIIAVRGQLFAWSLRHQRLKKKLYLHLLGKRYLQHAAALYCTDAQEAAAVARLGLGPPLFVVPNSIDTTPFAQMPVRGFWRHQYGITEEAIVLLYLGRLTQIKRPDIAVATLAACRERHADVHLILAGPDQDQMAVRLQAQAHSLGCLNYMHLTGALDPEQVRQVLADADLLIAPSVIQENFGLSTAEALAAGVPVLTSPGIPVGQLAEAWQAGRVAACTVEAFQHAAQAMITKPAELIALGRNGRLLAKAVFDVAAVVPQMLTHYSAIIERRLLS
ncbi:MAG: glycosyltransferase [Candidatus Viridilinea halotolerans]|uniref:Glycosyltransferase n=1 Tax=Candidatus Viridilinea halotolerans TaxID=2491704 RepID=A0A426UCL7_9CHLR|nr:MAG: glycosyltransferase [Candidatus Viridilinea halotolerans]